MKWEGEEKLDNYQDLICYICGVPRVPVIERDDQEEGGPMTICKNAHTPSRNDAYGRDGYSACCQKSSCQSQIGNQPYYKEIVFFEKKYELLNWINENPFEVKQ